MPGIIEYIQTDLPINQTQLRACSTRSTSHSSLCCVLCGKKTKPGNLCVSCKTLDLRQGSCTDKKGLFLDLEEKTENGDENDHRLSWWWEWSQISENVCDCKNLNKNKKYYRFQTKHHHLLVENDLGYPSTNCLRMNEPNFLKKFTFVHPWWGGYSARCGFLPHCNMAFLAFHETHVPNPHIMQLSGRHKLPTA